MPRMNPTKESRIREAIRGVVSIYPRAENDWIVQTVVEEFHFQASDVQPVFDAHFRITDPN